MNWPIWMLPIVVPIFGVIYVKTWIVERVIKGNKNWNKNV
jgi:hypothetical protein